MFIFITKSFIQIYINIFLRDDYNKLTILTVDFKLNTIYAAGEVQAPPVRQLLTRVMNPEKLVPVKSLSATTRVIDTTAIISAYSTT